MNKEKIDTLLNFTSSYFRLEWQGDHLQVDKVSDEINDENSFCLIDFIEDATTIFQYKVTQLNPNAEGFYLWVRNPANRSYKRLYHFLRKQYGKEFAYFYIPIAVQIAFQTTEPISAFCNIITFVKKLRLENNFDISNYTLIKNFIQSKFSDTPIDLKHIVNYMELENIPVCFISYANFLSIINEIYNNQDFVYPINIHAEKFAELLSMHPETELYLIDATLEPLKEEFEPYCIHYNFLSVKSRNNASVVSKEFSKMSLWGNSMSDVVQEMIRRKEIILGLVSGLHLQTPHYCHHIDCQYYKTNACRKWPAIPAKKDDCMFPTWFKYSFNHAVDTINGTLIPISPEERNQAKADYDRLSSKF